MIHRMITCTHSSETGIPSCVDHVQATATSGLKQRHIAAMSMPRRELTWGDTVSDVTTKVSVAVLAVPGFCICGCLQP